MSESKKLQEDLARKTERRKFLHGLGLGLTAGALAVAATNIDSIVDRVVGRVGPQNRKLQWIAPQGLTIPEGADWNKFDPDLDALGNIQLSWTKVGPLLVDKEVCIQSARDLEDQGLTAKQAFGFRVGDYVEIGIAKDGRDPNIFGETNDGQNKLLAGKCGPNGLEALLGHYVVETSEFQAMPTSSWPQANLESFLDDNPKATWA